MSDPPREDTAETIKKVTNMGVKVEKKINIDIYII